MALKISLTYITNTSGHGINPWGTRFNRARAELLIIYSFSIWTKYLCSRVSIALLRSNNMEIEDFIYLCILY